MAAFRFRRGLGLFLNLARISSFLLKYRQSTKAFIRKYDTIAIARQHDFRTHLKLSILLMPFASVSAANDGDDGYDSDKSFEPNDTRLRSSECLRNAAGLAVDSTSAVLSQTVYAIINIEKQYVDLLDALIQLMEYQTQVLGQKAEEDRIADIILEARHEINKVKKRKMDLALLFASVEKLADATAEVAFAAGSDYASTSAGERLYSAQQEVKRVLTLSEEAEKNAVHAETQFISELSKFAEKQAKLQENLDTDTYSDIVEGTDEGMNENIKEDEMPS